MMRELDLGSAFQITGQQTLGDIAAAAQSFDQRRYARQYVGSGIREFGRQGLQVSIEKVREIVRRVRHGKFREDAACNPAVGAPGQFDVFQRSLDSEDGVQRRDESAFAGAAGDDQGAINIPQDQRFHRGEITPPSNRGGKFSSRFAEL